MDTASASSSSQSALDIEFAKLQRRLDVIERIRADLENENITVPGIVVCGSQSAGKSSVLESISGVSFPRGRRECMPSVRLITYFFDLCRRKYVYEMSIN